MYIINEFVFNKNLHLPKWKAIPLEGTDHEKKSHYLFTQTFLENLYTALFLMTVHRKNLNKMAIYLQSNKLFYVIIININLTILLRK